MKKILFIVPLLALSFLTGCNSSNNQFSISLSTEDASITPNVIKKNTQYEGTITVLNNDKYLPGSLDYVKCGNEEIDGYQYNPAKDYKTASLVIPANKTTNHINVGITLEDTEIFSISLNTEEASITPNIIKKNQKYNGTIAVLAKNKHLPESLDYVKCDDKEIEYNYDPAEDYKTASLTIEASETTNSVNVGVTLEESEDFKYLCFTAEEDNSSVGYIAGTNIVSSINIQVSTDELNWTDWSGDKITLNKDEEIYVRNTTNKLSIEVKYQNYFQFEMTGKIAASGNVMSMINFAELSNYCFAHMFDDCESLTKAPKLPSTTITDQCYYCMFSGCTALKIPPDLPATNSGYECYSQMFSDCTSLIVAPSLIATTLDFGCYKYMFSGCTSLIETPELPATNLADECYYGMFKGCTSLCEAPELPATNLADECYYCMFKGCTSLKISEGNNGSQIFTCPDIAELDNPVTDMFIKTGGTFTGTPSTDKTYCYEDHALCFIAKQDDSSISYSITGSITPSIQTSTNQETYEDWNGSPITLEVGQKIYVKNLNNSLSTDDNNYLSFAMTGKIVASGNVNSMINKSELSNYCYAHLFDNCEALASAPALSAKTLSEYCYSGMFSGCTSLTSAPILSAKTLASHCYSEMFSGCTSLTSAPILSAETLAEYCYSGMFSGCTSLINTPSLSAETLAEYCYSGMFSGCTSLTKIPLLSAKTLAEYCYSGMFSGCTSLTNTPVLLAKNLFKGCYQDMFSGCSTITSAPELPAVTLADFCYNNMFNGCTSLMINEDSEAGINIFTCPDMTSLTDPVTDMFANTGGTFTNNPTSGKKYNYYHDIPEHLCLTAEENHSSVAYAAGADIVSSINIQVSTDEQNWTDWDGSEIFLDKNEKIYVKNIKDTLSMGYFEDSKNFRFILTGKIAASGNVNSLINNSELTDDCFSGLFRKCSSLTKAFISLPSSKLAEGCYRDMFYQCSSLISAPEILPAQTLASSCYSSMFTYCHSLTIPPIISAITLDTWCCYEMFYDCPKLKISDEEIGRKIFTCPSDLPENSVRIMFEGTGGTFAGTPTANSSYYYY